MTSTFAAVGRDSAICAAAASSRVSTSRVGHHRGDRVAERVARRRPGPWPPRASSRPSSSSGRPAAPAQDVAGGGQARAAACDRAHAGPTRCRSSHDARRRPASASTRSTRRVRAGRRRGHGRVQRTCTVSPTATPEARRRVGVGQRDLARRPAGRRRRRARASAEPRVVGGRQRRAAQRLVLPVRERDAGREPATSAAATPGRRAHVVELRRR